MLRILIVMFFTWATCAPVFAQTKLDRAHLDQLTASVALYPDALLSQILMASTYPSEVVAAAQWSKAHPNLSGDAATKAVASESWDPSVQSLVAFPSVLEMMGRQPQWVVSLGNAFLAQSSDVMDSVQRLRQQAQKVGALKTTKQQKVITEKTAGTTIVQIEPANPQVVYVPAYNPAVVYGAWPYPAYPPTYYPPPPPPPGAAFATGLVSGIGFGLGVAAVNSMWGGFNWGSHNVNINVNRYNNINIHNRIDVNRAHVDWQHNPAHRGNTPYNNPEVRNRFDNQRRTALNNREQAAPDGDRHSAQDPRDAARERAEQTVHQRFGQADGARNPGANDGRGATDARPGGAKPAPNANPQPAGPDRQNADRADARNRARAANRGNALRDAGDGERVRQQTEHAANFEGQPGDSQHTDGRRGVGGGGHFRHFGFGRR
ncbi:DUF3300 domain-containing protein [Burkholderia pseudomallei]|uniref:DUF3300 domain-containing protein n=1 Tax=Burkholderia pseudomallei TaxID=28450 RepID=UPI0009B5BCD5|nr:DUF3300 domain-containing protein [Burkholderia pseudomallei]